MCYVSKSLKFFFMFIKSQSQYLTMQHGGICLEIKFFWHLYSLIIVYWIMNSLFICCKFLYEMVADNKFPRLCWCITKIGISCILYYKETYILHNPKYKLSINLGQFVTSKFTFDSYILWWCVTKDCRILGRKRSRLDYVGLVDRAKIQILPAKKLNIYLITNS